MNDKSHLVLVKRKRPKDIHPIVRFRNRQFEGKADVFSFIVDPVNLRKSDILLHERSCRPVILHCHQSADGRITISCFGSYKKQLHIKAGDHFVTIGYLREELH